MNHDLSLSQSLGGLRIANPDDTSTSTSTASAHDFSPDPRAGYPAASYTRAGDTQQQFQEQLQPSSPPAPISKESRASTEPQPQAQSRRHSIFNILHRRGEPTTDSRPSSRTPPEPSDHKNQQRSDSTSSGSLKAQADAAARAAAVKAYRQSMPLNHQAQQQAQFPPYQSNPMQNGSRPYPPPGSSRPISGVYSAQPPPNAIPSRENGSYRLRNESSRSSILAMPSRSDSRGGTAMQAMQAGVPSRELSHRDRSYGQSHQLPSGNGPMPPRRSSRATASSHVDAMGSGISGGGSPAYDSDGVLIPVTNEARKENGAAPGPHEEYDASGNVVAKQAKKGVRDFSFGRTLGEGSYSTVLMATDRQTLKEYAVKILDKKHIIKEKKIKYVNIEKDTLNRLTEHPGIVRLYYTFQDAASLYYVLDIASGGELLGVLKKIGSFDVECTRFYGAQILDAIEHMHNRGVIHRDLKPENVLLDDQMHIKITDFGTAKLLPDPRKARGTSYDPAGDEEESTRAQSFVGTAEYVSPELLTDKNACKASDLWAFGCIIYQLLAGRPPFKAANEYLTFQKIVGLDYEFPPGFPPAARDLVERLLVLDPQRRLSLEHIKNHELFDGIVWGRGLWRQKAPRLKPYVPPPQEPTLIKLNGYSSAPQPIATTRGQQSSSSSTSTPRPQPRVITELPPPTQLDIEWSPVLTRDNERILKLGNLNVLSTPMPHSPSSKHGDHGDGHERKKFSRFFGGGNASKKKPRLVMITSSARILMLPPGGDEKRTKAEISLLASECTWRTQRDAKGQEVWAVDTRSTQYTFEDTKSSVITGDPSKSSAQEWIESLERAKDIALSHSMVGSYSSDTGFDMSSSATSPNSTLHGNMNYPEGFSVTDRSGRHHLSKSQASLGTDEQTEKPTNKKHRFSKRQSKTGLSTPF